MRAKKWVLLLVLASLLLGLGSTGVMADGAERPPPVDAWRAWVRFNGVVASRPADDTVGAWVIGGRSLQVTETTVFDETRGPAVVGAEVQVFARRVTATDTENGGLLLRAAAARLQESGARIVVAETA